MKLLRQAGLSVAVAGTVLALAGPPFAPVQDAPSHLSDIAVLHAPDRYAEWLTTGIALTGQGYQWAGAAFAQVLPLPWAARAALLFWFGVLAVGMVGVARRLGGSPAAALAAACAFAIGWPFAMGFFNFVAGLGLGACALALYWSPDRRTQWAGAALLAAAAGVHLIAAGMALGTAIAVDVVRRSGWRALLPLGLPACVHLAMVGLTLGEHAHIGGVAATPTTTVGWMTSLRDTWMCAYAGFSWLALALPAVVLAGAGWALRSGATGRGRALLWIGGAWLLLAFFMPLHALGWHYAGPRPLFFAWVLPVAAVPLSLGGGRWATAFTLAAALAVAGALPSIATEGARVRDVVASFPADTPVGRTFVVTHHPEALAAVAPYARLHLGVGRYAILSGGADPGQFAYNPAKHSVRFTRPMAELFPNTAELYMVVSAACLADAACAAQAPLRGDRAAASAVRWDTLTVTEPQPAFLERLALRGFEPITMGVWRPRPSSLEIGLQFSAVPSAPVVFRAGYPDTVGFFRGGSIPVGAIDRNEITVSFPDLPAGPLKIEIFEDRDGDGMPSDGDLILAEGYENIPPGEALRR